MKKKIIITLSVILLLVVGGFIFLAMNLNTLAAKFKPELEKIASDAVKMPVSFGTFNASVFPNTKISIDELKVGPDASSFKLNNLALHVKLSALLSRKLEITKLSVDSPEVTVIKTKDGIEIAGLPKPAAAEEKASLKLPVEEKEKSAAGKEKSESAPSAPIGVKLQSIAINDARLILKGFVAGKDLAVSKINFGSSVDLAGSDINISRLSLSALIFEALPLAISSENIKFNLAGGDLSVPDLKIKINQDVISISSEANINKLSSEVRVTSAQGVDIGRLIKSLPDFLPPAAAELNLLGKVKPDIKLKAAGNDMNFDGVIGLSDFSAVSGNFKVSELGGDIKFGGNALTQNISIEAIKLALNGQPVSIGLQSSVSMPRVDISNLAVDAFSGTVTTKGNIILEDSPVFTLNKDISNINIEEALQALNPDQPAMLGGTLEKVSANVKGRLDENLTKNLNGSLYFSLVNGTLKGVNIGGDVLKAVNNIPFISGSLYEQVGETNKRYFSGENTEIQSCRGNFVIANGSVTTRDLKLVSPAYNLDADGRIGMDASLDLNATISFAPDISEAIVQRVKELNNALDAGRRLNIPLTLKGQAPKIVVLPNTKKLLELGAKAAIRDKAGQLLEKKTGGALKDLGGAFGF